MLQGLTHLGKILKVEITSSIISDHNGIYKIRYQLQEKKKKPVKKPTNTGTLNHTILNNQQITEEIKKEMKTCLETNDNENMTTQNLWDE